MEQVVALHGSASIGLECLICYSDVDASNYAEFLLSSEGCICLFGCLKLSVCNKYVSVIFLDFFFNFVKFSKF